MNNKLPNKSTSQNSNIIIKNNKKKDNTIVNFMCLCKKHFKVGDNILYVLPCCHMLHDKCFNQFIISEQIKVKKTSDLECPICKNKISVILNENKIFSKTKYEKYQNDIMSVKIDNSAQINYMRLPLSMVKFTAFVNKAFFIETTNDLLNTLEYILRFLNIKINIIDNTSNGGFQMKNNILNWNNKKDNNSKTVIIANHSNYLDCFILYYIFRCGFIASEFINTIDIGKLIASKCKLLIFRRGIDTNMVEKIKEYLEEMKKIVIFPEGVMGNNNTLLRFRTGAFYTGANVCPVVIKYKNFVHDHDFKQMIFKLITQDEIAVDVYINDIESQPFDNDKIDKIREKMAKVGNLKLSRVANRDIVASKDIVEDK